METKSCQNCKQNFTIEPQDFAFYEKMQVPPPTFCPECRFQRRLMFRNERVLHRRSCDQCQRQIISVYAADSTQKVFCNPCWWGDGWDAGDYAQEYDPGRSFFEQFLELRSKTPLPALTVDAPTMINSDYVNYSGSLKNCYLVFDADMSENVLYSRTAVAIKDSLDCTIIGESELCCGTVMSGRASKLHFSYDCADCFDVWFSRQCPGCSNCFGCVNLKNKQYYIFNKPYTKEEYEKKIAEYRLDTWEGLERARRDALAFWNTIPDRSLHTGIQNDGSTGEYVYTSRNAKDAYIGRDMEDTRFCQFITMRPVRDCYDYNEWGNNAQRVYEGLTVGEGVDNVRFSQACFKPNTMNVEYGTHCISSQNLFGCVGLRKKQYSILNKSYTKEEFEALREKIIADMNERPYTDSRGRVFRYGEFFPYDLSPFAYNESTAVQSFLFPLTREQIEERGWKWRDLKAGEYQATMKSSELPQSIYDVQDSVTKELLECLQCKKPFRIVQQELDLLRRLSLPAPRKCPDCRYNERNAVINSPRSRQMTCDCGGTSSKNGIYSNAVPHVHGENACGTKFNGFYPADHAGLVYCRPCWDAEFL